MTECNCEQMDFQALGRRMVVGKFDGGMISSDAGGLLLREVEAKTGILARLSGVHRPPRPRCHRAHRPGTGRPAGVRPGAGLRGPQRPRPAAATIRCWRCWSGKLDPPGKDRSLARDRGKALAGKSTLNRLELTPCGPTPMSATRRSSPSLDGIERLFVDCFSGANPSAAGEHRAGPRRHRRSDARQPGGPLLPRLLRRLLLPAAVHLLRRAPAVRQAAAVEHRRGRWQR